MFEVIEGAVGEFFAEIDFPFEFVDRLHEKLLYRTSFFDDFGVHRRKLAVLPPQQLQLPIRPLQLILRHNRTLVRLLRVRNRMILRTLAPQVLD